MVLGTNPISLGAPANGGDNFVIDMATTATALGKVNIYYSPQNFRHSLIYTATNVPDSLLLAKTLLQSG